MTEKGLFSVFMSSSIILTKKHPIHKPNPQKGEFIEIEAVPLNPMGRVFLKEC
jgi:hypothetical protein